MKKKIIIGMIILAVLGSSIAVFANRVIEQQEIRYYEENTSYNSSEISSAGSNRIVNMSNYIKSIETQPEVINDLIFDYAYIVQIYSKSDEELNYIDSLVYNGAQISDIIEIYEFWLTTNEDISIIEQIYNLKGEITENFWIEEAYNQITENKHGVLNSADINDYINKGLKITDIRTANELCRKGVLTIQEILDRLVNGNTWDEIISIIESGNQNVTTVDDAAVILSASDMSLMTGASISDYIINDYAVENIETKSEEISSETNQDVYAILTDLSVLVDPLENVSNADLVQDIKNIIVSNGVTLEKTEQLLQDGYMLMDVLNASETAKAENKTIEEVLSRGGEE